MTFEWNGHQYTRRGDYLSPFGNKPVVPMRFKPPMAFFWESEWGSIRLPDDMPRPFRNDGWFDSRFAISPKVKEYLEEMTDRRRRGLDAISFVWWTKNRRHDVGLGNWWQP